MDRSAAYATRWVAKNIVLPVWLSSVRCRWPTPSAWQSLCPSWWIPFGTGTVADEKIEQAVEKVFDLTPAAIIRDLGLRKPIYRKLAAYGHMGREDLGVTWEKTDRTEALKAAAEA